jgi:hypothetical protein
MKLGATRVVITKDKGFGQPLAGQLDLIIVRYVHLTVNEPLVNVFLSALRTSRRVSLSRNS